MKQAVTPVSIRESIMKSVIMSQVVRAHEPVRFLCPIQSWRQLISLALVLAVGLPLIIALMRALDPSAPLAYIVIPALAGATIPMVAALPGRFSVITRFHARHFVRDLEDAIVSMGYTRCDNTQEGLRYRNSGGGWVNWRENEIALTVNEHAIAVGGPMFALRALQRRLAG
jgi:hypothetical protein